MKVKKVKIGGIELTIRTSDLFDDSDWDRFETEDVKNMVDPVVQEDFKELFREDLKEP